MFANISHCIGDLDAGAVTKQDIKDSLKRIKGLPRRNQKKYSKQTLASLFSLATPPEDQISSKTVKEHLKLLQGLFNTYLVKELELLSESPTDGVTFEYDDTRFGSLTDKQVVQALDASASKPSWFRWLLRLAVYTGARRSELAKLRTDDFHVCDDTGIQYILIREGKTVAATRRVPLHRELVASGLLELVKDKSGALFPIALNNHNRITELFGQLIPDRVNEYGERLVFHSIRHTFITSLRSKGVETAIVQELVGHSKTGAGVTDRYTHRLKLSDMATAIDNLSYG